MVHREFALVGWTVERLAFDYETSLLLLPAEASQQGRSCIVVLMGAFQLLQPNGTLLSMAAGPPFGHAGAMLELHRMTIDRFAASEEGNLEILLSEGAAIRASRDRQFESWATHGEVAMLCGPGDGPPWS